MFKKFKKTAAILAAVTVLTIPTFASAQSYSTYTVVKGDSLWKIAVKTETGVQELINLNTQLENPNLIYPNQQIKIPNIDDVKAFENQVITLTNNERAKHGLKPLQAHWELTRVARHKSEDMATKRYFSHTSPTYGSPFDMIKNYGISNRSSGENIAQGQRTPQEVVNAWMNSTGHRANILNKNYTHIGVGFSENGNYWTQMFIQQ